MTFQTHSCKIISKFWKGNNFNGKYYKRHFIDRLYAGNPGSESPIHNYRETGNYLERIFPFLDVRFVALVDSFDTLTAECTGDGYIVPLKNIINEVYSRDISRKTGTALAVKQRRGEFIGSWAAYT